MLTVWTHTHTSDEAADKRRESELEREKARQNPSLPDGHCECNRYKYHKQFCT